MFRIYEADPDADTLLTVPAPSAPFAEWNSSAGRHGSGLANGAALSNGHDDHDHHDSNGVNGVNGTNGTNGVSGANGAVNGLANGLSKVKLDEPGPELRIKVSSKHLSLASRHFANKLRRATDGSSPLPVQPDGRMHIRLDDDGGIIDQAAAVVVMNIIHGRGRRVPRDIDLDTLAKVAVFVDRYRCFDAVEAHADRWVTRLLEREPQGLPDTYGRDLVLWIYVAYVFHQPELFRRATAVAIARSPAPVSALGLPIRETIIRSINAQRQELAVQAATIIRDAFDPGDARHAAPVCTLGCDPFLRSALAQALSRAGISWPPPTRKPSCGPGSSGLDFAAVAAAASEVEQLHERWHATVGPLFAAPLYSSKPRRRKSPNSNPVDPGGGNSGADAWRQQQQQQSCAFKLRLTPALQDIETQIGGLDLESSLGYYLY